jgi:hypothetical protein
MNRASLDGWGCDLDAAHFACALATNGVLQGHGGASVLDKSEPEAIVARLREIEQEAKGTFACHPHIAWSHVPDDSALLAEAWMEFVRATGSPRLAVRRRVSLRVHTMPMGLLRHADRSSFLLQKAKRRGTHQGRYRSDRLCGIPR